MSSIIGPRLPTFDNPVSLIAELPTLPVHWWMWDRATPTIYIHVGCLGSGELRSLLRAWGNSPSATLMCAPSSLVQLGFEKGSCIGCEKVRYDPTVKTGSNDEAPDP